MRSSQEYNQGTWQRRWIKPSNLTVTSNSGGWRGSPTTYPYASQRDHVFPRLVSSQQCPRLALAVRNPCSWEGLVFLPPNNIGASSRTFACTATRRVITLCSLPYIGMLVSTVSACVLLSHLILFLGGNSLLPVPLMVNSGANDSFIDETLAQQPGLS